MNEIQTRAFRSFMFWQFEEELKPVVPRFLDSKLEITDYDVRMVREYLQSWCIFTMRMTLPVLERFITRLDNATTREAIWEIVHDMLELGGDPF